MNNKNVNAGSMKLVKCCFKRLIEWSSIMSKTKFLKFSEHGLAGIIQLNRPEALNAILVDMWTNFFELLLEMEHRKALIIVKGTGKAFSVGGDLKVMPSTAPERGRRIYALVCRNFDLIANYAKPYVALIDGLAMGGAAVFSVSGKYCVATERATFAMPENRIGYFNDAGASYFLSRLDNNFGIYMGMTAISVKGSDIKKVGLASHYIESHRLDELETNLVNCTSHEDVRRVLDEFSAPINNELDDILPKIKHCFGGETVEIIFENLRCEGSDWAKKTLETLAKMSPISLKVSHRSITRGKNISLRDCLKMEMRLYISHMDDSDFREGVRALIIDKDFKPKWSRNSIYDVTEDDVERFFKSKSDAHELRFDTPFPNKL